MLFDRLDKLIAHFPSIHGYSLYGTHVGSFLMSISSRLVRIPEDKSDRILLPWMPALVLPQNWRTWYYLQSKSSKEQS